MVVISAGIRPNVELAIDAGLTVERGIVVTDELRCPGDPHVYAVGECAQHRGQLYGLVAPLWEQAKVLADRLAGRIPDAALRRLARVDQAEGDGHRPRRDGRPGADRARATRW